MFDKTALQNLTDADVALAIAELKEELDERARKHKEKEKKAATEFENVIASATANGIHYYIRRDNDELYLEDYPIYCEIY